jgi:hypothetical protein
MQAEETEQAPPPGRPHAFEGEPERAAAPLATLRLERRDKALPVERQARQIEGDGFIERAPTRHVHERGSQHRIHVAPQVSHSHKSKISETTPAAKCIAPQAQAIHRGHVGAFQRGPALTCTPGKNLQSF